NVVGNLHEAYGQGLERTARRDQRILRGLRFKVVRGFGKETARLLRNESQHLAGKLRMAVESGTDSRAAERHLAERLLRLGDPLQPQFDLPGIAPKLLPQPYGGSIL